MQDAELFTDEQKVKIISPYKKLRELRGISQEQAAEIFGVSRRTILEVENGTRDASKKLIREMDRYYGCNGRLIEYWLPKFSADLRKEKPRTVCQQFGEWVKKNVKKIFASCSL